MSEGRRNFNFWLALGGGVALATGVALAFTFEKPNVETVQQGYRGIGMEQVYNDVTLAMKAAANQVPEAQPPIDPAGQPASAVYENVQVLGDMDANEFMRLMGAITEWVSPVQGCAYCHQDGEPLSADTLYTKRVSRRMLQMTQHINTAWQSHVGQTGVTCYTCHRGKNVPENLWFAEPANPQNAKGAGNDTGQNQPSAVAGLSSLPHDPFARFLGDAEAIRVVSKEALPNGNPATIKDTERTYALMMHMSQALGVNCTFCHNSRSFIDWSQSSPQRVTSFHGIRMLRDVNNDYLIPLKPEYPPIRLGPAGDAPKASCATCHQGAAKPLLGANMLEAHPVLAAQQTPRPAQPPAPAPALPAAPTSPATPTAPVIPAPAPPATPQ